jgi:NADH dehydrogenase
MAAEGKISCVAVFGGSGFLGGEIVKRLAAEGIMVRVAVRHPEKARIGENLGQAREILQVYADVRDETSVALALEGCDAVVNSVGLYVERGSETFEAVHELGALNVAHQCAIQSVGRLIHISGIGADMNSESSYVRARAKGELLARDVFPRTTVFRPSVLFGPNDRFINTLAKIIRHSPILPLFGQGRTKLQAVYVGDVAWATLRALQNPTSQEHTYELGGPHAYTYRALVELVLAQTSKRRLLLPVPFEVWDLLAAVASFLPVPPLTHDQIALMKRDNVVARNALSLEDLGVGATALEDVIPQYAF